MVEATSLSRNGAKVVFGSMKMSLGIGRSLQKKMR